MQNKKNKTPQNITELRKAKRMTQKDIAEITGISQPTISRIEKNVTAATIDQIEKIAQALDVSENELYLNDNLDKRQSVHITHEEHTLKNFKEWMLQFAKCDLQKFKKCIDKEVLKELWDPENEFRLSERFQEVFLLNEDNEGRFLLKETWEDIQQRINKKPWIIGQNDQEKFKIFILIYQDHLEKWEEKQKTLNIGKYAKEKTRPYNRMELGEASKLLQCMKNMPELSHDKRVDQSERFNIDDSDVIKWAWEQPEIKRYIYERIRKTGFIQYDPDTKKWHGINFNKKELSSDKISVSWKPGIF